MAFCLAELHLWSTKSSLQVKDTDIGTYQYYDKGEPAHSLEHHYYSDKLHFCQARGYPWTPRNHRPEKLCDSLKELEELLQTNSCIHTRWRNKYCCQLLLSNGVLVTLALNGPHLKQVCIDHTLVGRLPGNTVTDAVLSNGLILLSFLERGQVAAVYLNKRNQDSLKTGRRTDKLSPSEIKVACVEVGKASQRLRRRVVLNRLQDVALCWWNLDEHSEEPWMLTDTQRNNLFLISCSPTEGLKILCSVRTEGNPLDCCFSQLQHYQMLMVELPAGPQGFRDGTCANACVYECVRGRLHRLSVVSIPLPSHPLCCSRHPSESILLLGLSDSSLVLFDQRRGVSLMAPCPVPPTYMGWHPAGAVAIVAGGQKELMCFDVGLAPLNMSLVAEEMAPAATLRLTQHLHCSGDLVGLKWGTGLDGGPEGTNMIALVFNGGPLAALRLRLGALTGGQLGLGELLQQRLRCGQVREALGILEAMDWSTMRDECYQGLSSIMNHLLRQQLNAQREAQLEAALGVFYAPSAPLSDTVILEYREPVSKYARRFFHHLLSHQRFEKAFLLAVDLKARDLFMDLHYVAADKGEVVLADVAKRKANETADCDDLMSSRNESSLTDRRAQRSSLLSDSITLQSDGRSGRRKPQRESIHVTVSPDLLRVLRQNGNTRGDTEGRDDDDDPEKIHVVHLGMV